MFACDYYPADEQFLDSVRKEVTHQVFWHPLTLSQGVWIFTTSVIYIIQLTPHRGVSVTDYIKYYAYLYYLLVLDYLSLQQLWYYFPI
jgi:hypothetical protein